LPKSAVSKIQHPPRTRARPPPRFIRYFENEDDDDEFRTLDSDQSAFGNKPARSLSSLYPNPRGDGEVPEEDTVITLIASGTKRVNLLT
jgi:hypothetical protein